MRDKRGVVVLLLALAGAGVDATFIMGFNVLSAAQTGNTILLAVALARGDAVVGLSAAISVAAFVGGAAAAAWVIAWVSSKGHAGKAPTAALALEVLLIASALVLWRLSGTNVPGAVANVLVALAAFSMGIQSAVVLILHTPTTTYVTGMLTSFTAGMTQQILARRTSLATTDPTASRNGWVWVAYLASAIVSGMLFLHIRELALLLPLAALIGAMLLRPEPAEQQNISRNISHCL